MEHPPQFPALVDEARKRITELAPEDVRARVKGGAVNVSRGTLEMRVGEVVPDKNAQVP